IHKENPEVIDDDEKNDDVGDKDNDDHTNHALVGTQEIGSLESKQMQTPIPTPPRSPRINVSLDKNIVQELTDIVSPSTTTRSKDPHKKRRISRKYSYLPRALLKMCRRQGYMIRDIERKCVTTGEFWKFYRKVDQVLHEILMMKSNLQDQANDPALWDVLKRKFEKFSTSNTSCRDDDFQSQHHNDHQEYDASPEITEFQNVVKRIPTIFDHARMEVTRNDMLSYQFRNTKDGSNIKNPNWHLRTALYFLRSQNPCKLQRLKLSYGITLSSILCPNDDSEKSSSLMMLVMAVYTVM
nr:hypothetical protein [Tanacetum cinerariifolium]